jgi:mRNA-degrading endonuclease RelE of RelBE toxin-antitoxin system
MCFRIVPTPEFGKQVKKLSKKYPKMQQDLTTLQDMLSENPTIGTPLGNNCYKVRLQNTSVKRGKSGGFRVIILLIEEDKIIRLLAIYSKSEKESIPDEEIKKILKKNNLARL